jgi:hypothetical protein
MSVYHVIRREAEKLTFQLFFRSGRRELKRRGRVLQEIKRIWLEERRALA